MTSEHLVWIREAPADLKTVRRSQRSRRSHKKSRHGCNTCKVRRVKCDEQIPVCGQCEHRGTDCSYQHARVNGFSHNDNFQSSSAIADGSPYATTSDLSAEACLGVHVFATSISRVVDQRASDGLSSNSLAHLLQHFERSSYSTISSPVGQQILHDKIPQMLMSHPFLLHTVLAFSSSHISYLSRDKGSKGNLLLTVGYHTQRALNLYAKRITMHQNDVNHNLMRQPSSLEEMDALFASCIMLTSLFYHVDEMDLPHRSWTLSPPDQSLLTGRCEPSIDWLTNTSGLSILIQLSQFQSRLTDSIWLPFILEASRITAQMNGQTPSSTTSSGSVQTYTSPSTSTSSTQSSSTSTSTELSSTNTSMVHDFQAAPLSLPSPSHSTLPNMPPHLLALILSQHNIPNQSIYAAAITSLNPLLSLDPKNLYDFAAFISFPSRLSQDFITLLRRKRLTVPRPGFDEGAISCSLARAQMRHDKAHEGVAVSKTTYGKSYDIGIRTSIHKNNGIYAGNDTVCGLGPRATASPITTTTATTINNNSTIPNLPPFDTPMPDFLLANLNSNSTTFFDCEPQSTKIPLPTALPNPIPTPSPDPLALLIMGYWFDLIGHVPHWWCSRRGRGESVTILRWLEMRITSGTLHESGTGSGDGEYGMQSDEYLLLFARAVREFGERIEERERKQDQV